MSVLNLQRALRQQRPGFREVRAGGGFDRAIEPNCTPVNDKGIRSARGSTASIFGAAAAR